MPSNTSWVSIQIGPADEAGVLPAAPPRPPSPPPSRATPPTVPPPTVPPARVLVWRTPASPMPPDPAPASGLARPAPPLTAGQAGWHWRKETVNGQQRYQIYNGNVRHKAGPMHAEKYFLSSEKANMFLKKIRQ